MIRVLAVFISVLVVWNHEVAAFRFARNAFLQHQKQTSSCLYANKGAPPQTAYSYVEGGDYESRRQEIEAMGGDPFFLSDDDDLEEKEEANEPFMTNRETPMGGPDPTAEEERYATDGKGPTPRDPPKKEAVDEDWEWDGIVDEDAHMMDF